MGVFADVRDRGSVCEVAGVSVSDVLLIDTVVVPRADWVTYSVRVSGALCVTLRVDVAVDSSVELIETPMESVPGMADRVRDGGGDGVPTSVAVLVWLLEGRDDSV